MAATVQHCVDVLDPASWDYFFCVCPDDPPNCNLSSPISGLTGQQSTSAGSVTVTGSGDIWLNPDNAKTDDGTYASVILEDPYTNITTSEDCQPGSQYIVLTDYGFSVPADATILGIVVGFKGHEGLGSQGGRGDADHFASQVWNQAVVVDGVFHYTADPTAIFCQGESASDPYSFVEQGFEGFAGNCAEGLDAPCDNLVDTIRLAPIVSYGDFPVFSPTLPALTGADVNSPNFGFAVSLATLSTVASGPMGFLDYLDCIGIGVYYASTPVVHPMFLFAVSK